MQITDVQANYPRYKYPLGAWRTHFWQIVVRIESDVGHIGFGYGGGGMGALEVINRHFRELLIGRSFSNIDDIRDVWDTLYFESLPYGRKGIAVMALSGVDLALWDLLGKERKVPVYELLGGLKKPKVRAYASGNDMEKYRDMGYTANKFGPGLHGTKTGVKETVAAASKSRDVFGNDGLIMTDCYMAWDEETTLQMANAVTGLNVYWFEDILTPDLLDKQAEIRPLIKPINLAGGEHEFTRFGFEAIAQANALDIWQPDITWCGGITETLRILDLAKLHKVPVIPHRGGEIWGLHLIAATDCENLAETHPERWSLPNNELWINEPHVVDGHLTLPDKPGFGVELNESML